MRTSLDLDLLNKITYLTGNKDVVETLSSTAAKAPFDDAVIEFLNDTSRVIMANKAAKQYSDVITFAFWIRKASVLKLKERFASDVETIRLGKGVVFHVAPSNVPVNFAYSMVSGLLAGNANIIRVPSKEFEQVSILADAFNEVLESRPELKPYIVLVRYGHDKEINDAFSSIADMRIVWGGDETIAELRQSPLLPRSGEVTFADRYSFAIIDSDSYLALPDKKRVAEDFYNDTYFSDQNACTSPRLVVWTGKNIEAAKNVFWEQVHTYTAEKYMLQPVQGVNKLTSSYLTAVAVPESKIIKHRDNLVIRVEVPYVSNSLMDYKDNSGFFFEYDCKDIMELKDLCNDVRCQTIAYIGDEDVVLPLIKSGVRGIDRVVPMGKTMDFDLIWDGYNLLEVLSRTIVAR